MVLGVGNVLRIACYVTLLAIGAPCPPRFVIILITPIWTKCSIRRNHNCLICQSAYNRWGRHTFVFTSFANDECIKKAWSKTKLYMYVLITCTYMYPSSYTPVSLFAPHTPSDQFTAGVSLPHDYEGASTLSKCSMGYYSSKMSYCQYNSANALVLSPICYTRGHEFSSNFNYRPAKRR